MIKIRPEEPSDYSQIADIIYEAFSDWQQRPFRGEPCIVDALRSGQFYDPELALVAEDEETHRIVGHAFFSCMPAILLGQERYGAYLAPLTVAPAYQRQGIGRQLLEQGARVARKKGISFILICGHPEYYKKYAYKPNAFAMQGCTVDLSALCPDRSIIERPVRQSDLPWLTRRWKQLHMEDRLALYPGDLIVQWFNHSPNYCHASVFVRVRQDGLPPAEEEILGYVRYRRNALSGEVRVSDLVPMEGQAASTLCQISSSKALALPLFAATAARLGLHATEAVVTSPAFFMLNVNDDPVVEQYLKEQMPGIVIFPSVLDLDE